MAEKIVSGAQTSADRAALRLGHLPRHAGGLGGGHRKSGTNSPAPSTAIRGHQPFTTPAKNR
jgi:hypothetical protein